MTNERHSLISVPFRGLLYTLLAVFCEFFALFAVLIRIDETPMEGSAEGNMLVLAAFGIAAAFSFFVLHHLFFGRLYALDTNLRAHWSRTWAAYLLIPLGGIAGYIGITGSEAVVLLDRPWFEVLWNGPAALALIPILVDALRMVGARMLRMSSDQSARH